MNAPRESSEKPIHLRYRIRQNVKFNLDDNDQLHFHHRGGTTLDLTSGQPIWGTRLSDYYPPAYHSWQWSALAVEKLSHMLRQLEFHQSWHRLETAGWNQFSSFDVQLWCTPSKVWVKSCTVHENKNSIIRQSFRSVDNISQMSDSPE